MIGEIATLLALGAAHKHITNKKEEERRAQQRAQQRVQQSMYAPPRVAMKYQCRYCGKMQTVYNVNSLQNVSCPAAGKDSRGWPIKHIWQRIG